MRRTPRPTARVTAALVGAVLGAGLVVGCSSDEPDPAAEASQDVAAEPTAEPTLPEPGATSGERIQAVVDALPELDETALDRVGQLPELPDGVLADDVALPDVASFGSDEFGWYVLQRLPGPADDNATAIEDRLVGAGFTEAAPVDPEGMTEMRVFTRAADDAVVGLSVADVTGQSADDQEFPTRAAFVVAPALT
ncbi:hypothetical protein [Nocardioides zeae]|uniref:SPOR domain-containing protein n=1 Tax=Nocardioides zeae TaxID=1457234 RepID=A0A6P0HMH3_9ACTN|nr:hypothetical protein [Nocardioides zeae]NEN79823.1 hypothetical protein [Nocardioides zeae]